MTIGRKSITTTIIVPNAKDVNKPHEIIVQANKNYAICDMSPRINEVLSDFQGRQLVYRDITSGRLYLNEEIVSELKNTLNINLQNA